MEVKPGGDEDCEFSGVVSVREVDVVFVADVGEG